MSRVEVKPRGSVTVAAQQGIMLMIAWLAEVAYTVAPPLLRLALAVPFFNSGLTKWVGFLTLSPGAVYLFEEEFKLHIFGSLYNFPAPIAVAFLDGVAEIVLPILLVVGLATRFSALGLLVMTAVIEFVVPDGWANFHLPWAAMAMAILALGPGPLSLDRLFARWMDRQGGKEDKTDRLVPDSGQERKSR